LSWRDETFRRKGREIRSGGEDRVLVVLLLVGWWLTSERRALVKKVGWEGVLCSLFLVFSNTLLFVGLVLVVVVLVVVLVVLVFDRVPANVVLEAFDPSVYPGPDPAEEEEYLSLNGRITFL
jgi:hypothetical protein